ncbi:GNAT family N-acetyltransferase [Nonomuraea sp. WAC 01424]|uniref:GNAT family N-acetyltransferase n=1 Tax=Nonomuraea sp. WAC 01424 TaxID=2203200 RepID=UPI001C8B14CA|nr:GNAT family N-acetyltransferase [Nonomuraea sp. WAC 01424]
MIHELRDLDGLRAACGDDDLIVWAAQDLRGPARAWAGGNAVVAAAPDIARHDRLAVWGDPRDAVTLVGHALAELGPTYRPLGERELMRQVIAMLEGLRDSAEFTWMSLAATPGTAPGTAPSTVPPSEVGWLDGDAEPEIKALLAGDAPSSYAVPGASGVRRWAGVRVGDELAAVAADAWSAPSVGLLAGVATAARFRGRGLAERVCGWMSSQLVAAHGRAALMVDDVNTAAIKVYERIGYRRLPVLACHVAAPGRHVTAT